MPIFRLEADVLEEVRRLAVFTSGVAELTRNRAEQLVKTFAGDASGARAAALVRQLMETSRENRKEVARLIRGEIQSQIAALGLVDRRELDSLERRVTRLEAEVLKSTRKKTPVKKATGRKKRTSRAASPGSAAAGGT